jgi:hypothetical protein
MFERELKRFRSLVRARQYILTIHALEETGEDDVFDEDIEKVIPTGQIVERQVDRATRERKYVFTRRDRAGEPVGVVVKMDSTGKAVVITVYREEERCSVNSAAPRQPLSRRRRRALAVATISSSSRTFQSSIALAAMSRT